MTNTQFNNLKVGDKVVLPWSTNPNHIVVDIQGDVVDTKFVNDGSGVASHMSAIYSNNFKDIQLPGGDTIEVPLGLFTKIYNIAKCATKKVEDWSYGDSYPTVREEMVFPKDIIMEMQNLLR